MKPGELNEIHRSPASWILGSIYFAPRDPRLLVRKRIGALGWTLNFARPMALPLLFGTIGAFAAGLWGLAALEVSADLKWGGAIALLTLMISIWAWIANPRRYID